MTRQSAWRLRCALGAPGVLASVIFCCTMGGAVPVWANDSDDATRAMRALLALSNEVIPKRSTCYGNYGQRGAATVKDVLAAQLGNLSPGKNLIRGECTNGRCSVRITHDGGSEDVASAEFKFAVRNGKAVISTLTCLTTP